MKFLTSNSPEVECAKAIAEAVNLSLENNKKVLLLLAGGSAIKIVNELQFHLTSDNYSNLSITLTDERWDYDPEFKDGTWKDYIKTETFKKLALKGANMVPVLHGQQLESDQKQFQEFLDKAIKNDYQIIALLGIGPDGHTAGIMPAERYVFEKTNLLDLWAIGHHIDSRFPGRITISPRFLKKIDRIFVYAIGEQKKEILNTLARLDKYFGDESWQDSLHMYPALYLSGNNARIFTDQTIEAV